MNQEKENRIPFDWELYQKGYEAVYDSGEKPKQVKSVDGRPYKIISVTKNGSVRLHWPNGREGQYSKYDLFLIPPQPKPEPEMFVEFV